MEEFENCLDNSEFWNYMIYEKKSKYSKFGIPNEQGPNFKDYMMDFIEKIKKKFHLCKIGFGSSSVTLQGTVENLQKFLKTEAGEHPYWMKTLSTKFYSGVADDEGIYLLIHNLIIVYRNKTRKC